MEGTHIDHPVVQGKDNFEYLDKDFYGEYYTAGSLFLDYINERNFKDSYNIIHGHHMTNGSMFGDLQKYKNESFFNEHKEGTLLTPKYDYDLEVFAAVTVNAYDRYVYNAKNSAATIYDKEYAISKNKRKIKLGKDDKVLALSTCSGEMNENRVVVFAKMYNKRNHE